MEARSWSSVTGSASCHSANSGGATTYASEKFRSIPSLRSSPLPACSRIPSRSSRGPPGCRAARSAFANAAAISCFSKTTFAPYKALMNLIGASSPLEYGPMLLRPPMCHSAPRATVSDVRGKLRPASKAALARNNSRFDLSIVLSGLPEMTRGTKSLGGFICSVCLRCLSIKL